MKIQTLTPDELLRLTPPELYQLLDTCANRINEIQATLETVHDTGFVAATEEKLSEEWRRIVSLRKILWCRLEELQEVEKKGFAQAA